MQIPDNAGAGNAVVQEKTLTVEKRPQKSDSEKSQPQERCGVSNQRAPQADGASVTCDQLELPGLHRERLSATRPLPNKIHAGYHRKIQLIESSHMQESESIFNNYMG